MSLTVLHVAQPVDGGVARCLVDLVRDQVQRGWRVLVAGPSGAKLRRDVVAGGAEHFHWHARRAPGPRTPVEMISLARIVRATAPDLVHLHSSKAGLAGRLVVRGRRPTIFQPHAWSFFAVPGPLRRLALLWERFGARWSDVIVCVSDGERASGEEAGVRATWQVVPNGIDLDVFDTVSEEGQTEARVRLGLDAKRIVVCIGRLSRQKGQDLLVAAWPDVQRQVPDAELLLVGGGPAEAALRREGQGQIVGDREDVHDWLAAADVVALPSRWEGLAYTVLESMAVGRSVVATDVPGMKEALGDSGVVVPRDDVHALAEAVAARLQNAAARDADGKVGRERAERFYDVRRSTARMAELYLELTKRQ